MSAADLLPSCPQCAGDFTYAMGTLLVCPSCDNEWSPSENVEDKESIKITDSVGNILTDGDTVTVVKDLRVKGSSSVVKVGTRVKNIRLVNGVGEHDLDCKVPGFGPMQLKSSVVKKV